MKRIAFLGGSISKGEGVKFEENFVSQFEEKINEGSPADPCVQVVWRGESGTMSSNGIFRLDELMLKKPDLVFLDYAMNDNGDRFLAECFEGIVYRLLEQNVYVVILLFCNVYGSCTRGAMDHIAEIYHVPVIDVGKNIFTRVQEGTLDWDLYAKDYVHPTAHGHEMIADYVCEWYRNTDHEEAKRKEKAPEQPAFTGAFWNIYTKTFYDKMKSAKPGELIFSEQISCRMILIEFYQDQKANPAAVYIEQDGTVVAAADAYASMAWGNRVAKYICGDGSLQEYKIAIRLSEDSPPCDWNYSKFDLKFLIGK